MHKDDPKTLDIRAVGRGTNTLDMPNATRAVPSRVYALDRWLLGKILETLGDPPFSILLWNGEEIRPRDRTPEVRLRIQSRRQLYRLLTNPNMHFGDDYSSGQLEVEGNLVAFLENIYRDIELFEKRIPLVSSILWRDHRPRATTLARSRDNIHHHYDLGNGFYQWWLDREAMQYTCAYFPRPEMTLEEAQLAKMHHVCRKLRLKAEDTVVEAGCGWGGFALFMARHYGVRVKAYNISHEQIVFANRRAAETGLKDRVEYIEDDYRNIQGHYDVFVSIGMLEHVGPANYRALGTVIDRCLNDKGRGLIHSIGRNRPLRMSSWIERRIFPGAYPPTLREMMAVFEPFSFSVLDIENLRLHYAKTLQHWLARFEEHGQEVRQLYDETFVRAWRLYLSGSIASFTTGWLQLYQVLFHRAHNNDLPWSRDYLYV
jgi:cyclopropane-fatty-acyl-phospholipid synthase